MMRIEMSEEYRAEMAALSAKWEREAAQLEQQRARAVQGAWSQKWTWRPIEECPFQAFQYEEIYVSDGASVALARVKKRFGRPVRITGNPEMVFRDGRMTMEGGKLEEIDAPDWWFEWELEDVNGRENYAGGEPIGKDEVSFVATHWLPVAPWPAPPQS